MKLKELLGMLNEFSPESKVTFNAIIEHGRGVSICRGGDCYVDWDEEEECVVLDVSGEENEYD